MTQPILAAMLLVMAATSAFDANAQASAPASAPMLAPPVKSLDSAAAACQRKAQTTLQYDRPDVSGVNFAAPPTAVPAAADATDLMLRGTGRAVSSSGSRVFSYSCTFNVQEHEVTGVVVRDAAGVARKTAPRTVEPDLRHVSPAACESSAASAITRRWPTVQSIVFDDGTRQLSQNASGQAHMQGQGKATLKTGGPSTHFSYDCSLDANNGKVTDLQLKQ